MKQNAGLGVDINTRGSSWHDGGKSRRGCWSVGVTGYSYMYNTVSLYEVLIPEPDSLLVCEILVVLLSF